MLAATVLFATYNEPRWLEWVLWGYATQTHKAFEVIVVDDGSRDDTRARIDALRPQMPYRLRHFWQPDEGYQKCKGMNRAILLAESDYLVFTDGDCIPRSITHMQSGVRTLGELEAAFKRGAVGVIGWPLDDAMERQGAKGGAQADYTTIVRLIQQPLQPELLGSG